MRYAALILCCAVYAGSAFGVNAKSTATIALLKRIPHNVHLNVNDTPVTWPKDLRQKSAVANTGDTGRTNSSRWLDKKLLDAVREVAVKEGPVEIHRGDKKPFSPYAKAINLKSLRDFNNMLSEKSHYVFDTPYQSLNATYYDKSQRVNPHTHVVVKLADNLTASLYDMSVPGVESVWRGGLTHKLNLLPLDLAVKAELDYYLDRKPNAWSPASLTVTRREENGDRNGLLLNSHNISSITTPYGAPGGSKVLQQTSSADVRWQALEGFVFGNDNDIEVAKRTGH